MRHAPTEGMTDLREFAWRFQWTELNQNSLVLNGHAGGIYYTDPAAGKIWMIDGKTRQRREVDSFRDCNGMCVSTDGWLVSATEAGVQICDQPGRVHLMMSLPYGSKRPCYARFGGPDNKTLYVANVDKILSNSQAFTPHAGRCCDVLAEHEQRRPHPTYTVCVCRNRYRHSCSC